MYTYVRTFVGLPLSQINSSNPEFLAFLAELSELGTSFEEAPLMVEEYDFDDDATHSLIQTFCQWVADNAANLRALGYSFESSYHGGSDAPVILGKYVDSVFNVPDLNAAPFNFEGVAKLSEEAKAAHDIFSTIPKEVRDVMDEDWCSGAWFNNHSS